MTGFRHDMPFGAAYRDGATTFRLWAPGADEVGLTLPGRGQTHAMPEAGGGWRELTLDGIAPGTAYAFALGNGLTVPDPASRAQAGDVHGPSLVVDPQAHRWRVPDWTGRPFEETVLYELHPGTFGAEGGFAGVEEKLGHLAETGITAVELMPVADFSGTRNWGYDGVLQFAPARAYGPPEALKRLVDAAHARGLMVFLDVVYNHFGPDGNYLHAYAPQFFTDRHETPWGAAIDFSRPEVREFFVHNTLYWLEEFRIDGLRYDAVHAILDDGEEHILDEIARRARAALPGRHVHLVLENDDNAARYLRAGPGEPGYDAQWNDDYHHVAHVLATGESGGYYADYQEAPHRLFARALAEGFVYQGEASPFRDGERRGEPSGHLPPRDFVDFVQNHDQVGNRAFGERLTALAPPEAVETLTAILLLSPAVPMLFMGEEWGETRPFLFFCDFHDELAEAVRNGRRSEFGKFPEFADEAARAQIPDPNDPATRDASRLDWTALETEAGQRRHALVRQLLALRKEAVLPWTRAGLRGGRFADWGARGIHVTWPGAGGGRLDTVAQLGARGGAPPAVPGRTIYESSAGLRDAASWPDWSVRVTADGSQDGNAAAGPGTNGGGA